MAFSPHAALLMHELKQIIATMDGHIANIATELSKGRDADDHQIRMEAVAIGIIMREFHNFSARVRLGPDAPVNSDVIPTYPNNIPWHTVEHKARQATSAFNQWPTLQTWINARLDFQPGALYQTLPDGYGAIAEQQTALNKVFDILHALINPNKQDQTAADQRGFADIPLPQSLFIQHVQAAARITRVQKLGRPARFIDVGCGGGMKVLTAAQYFSPCDGLDFDPGYVDAAKTFMNNTNQHLSTIYEADALTFEHYNLYDVIYFFRPINDSDLLSQLEDRIATHARPHSLLIAPYTERANRLEDAGAAKVAGNIYLAQGTQAEADALRVAAENVAPYAPDLKISFDPMWDPIKEALF